MTVPLAFQCVAEGTAAIESRARKACREWFHRERLLARIAPDIEESLSVGEPPVVTQGVDFDADDGAPGGLWDPALGEVDGGANRADEVAAPLKPEPRDES